MKLKEELLALQRESIQLLRTFEERKAADTRYQSMITAYADQPAMLRMFLEQYHRRIRAELEDLRVEMEYLTRGEGLTGWLYVGLPESAQAYPLSHDIILMDGDCVFVTPLATNPDRRPWWRVGLDAAWIEEERVTQLPDGRYILWVPATKMDKPEKNLAYAQMRFQRFHAGFRPRSR